jgi:hypothetical protein
VTAVGPDGKTVTARVPIQLETKSAPTSTGETDQGGAAPTGSVYGDSDPPAAEPAAAETSESSAGETALEPAPGESLTPSSPEAAPGPSAAPAVSSVELKPGDSRKKTVGTILLLGMLGLGSAAAAFRARSVLSFVLRGVRAGSALN